MKADANPRRIMRVSEALAASGAGCKRTLLRWEAAGLFPQSIRVGARKLVAWWSDDIAHWQRQQTQEIRHLPPRTNADDAERKLNARDPAA